MFQEAMHELGLFCHMTCQLLHNFLYPNMLHFRERIPLSQRFELPGCRINHDGFSGMNVSSWWWSFVKDWNLGGPEALI